MRRLVITSILVFIVFVGSWVLFNRDRIKSPRDLVALAKQDLSALGVPIIQASATLPRTRQTVFPKTMDTVRIATFKLNGKTGAAQEIEALALMTEICAQFDLIAFQEVNSGNPEWSGNLQRSLAAATGIDYAFIASPFVNGKQFAILYNSSTLELDQSHFYTVHDPDQLFSRPPLVGWFRARGPNSGREFTFSLVNVQLDPKRTGQELKQLGNLYRSIRQDGRQEDDILVVGDFQTGEQGLDLIKQKAGLESVVANLPTDTLRTAQFDNVLFSPAATIEFAGAAGTFDFMQRFNLFLNDSLAISEHLPVWAEFSIYEGVRPGQVAGEAVNRR